MAVIKANGYGHGMLRVAHALETAEGFAVLNVEEAVALREAGFNQTILLLEGFFSVDELPTLAEYRLASVIHCPEQIEMLEMAGLPVKLDVFLKLNSGMNRLGFRPEAFGAALQRLQTARAVGRITLMTHFACADEAQGIAAQLDCFDALLRVWTRRAAWPIPLPSCAIRKPTATGCDPASCFTVRRPLPMRARQALISSR